MGTILHYVLRYCSYVQYLAVSYLSTGSGPRFRGIPFTCSTGGGFKDRRTRLPSNPGDSVPVPAPSHASEVAGSPYIHTYLTYRTYIRTGLGSSSMLQQVAPRGWLYAVIYAVMYSMVCPLVCAMCWSCGTAPLVVYVREAEGIGVSRRC